MTAAKLVLEAADEAAMVALGGRLAAAARRGDLGGHAQVGRRMRWPVLVVVVRSTHHHETEVLDQLEELWDEAEQGADAIVSVAHRSVGDVTQAVLRCCA